MFEPKLVSDGNITPMGNFNFALQLFSNQKWRIIFIVNTNFCIWTAFDVFEFIIFDIVTFLFSWIENLDTVTSQWQIPARQGRGGFNRWSVIGKATG